MKNFKEFLNEVEKDNQLAKSVKRDSRPRTTSSKQIGFIHFNHGVDYDVIQADSHDLAYFGKGVVRLKGRTTGKETAAYVDWKNGTIRFNSGTDNDKEFDKPLKFKAASLYESLEDLELLENAALIESDTDLKKIAIEVADLIDVHGWSVQAAKAQFKKRTGKIVKGRSKDEVSDTLRKMYESFESMEELNEALTKTSPNVKKIVTALKKKFDVDVDVENKKIWNKKEEIYDHSTEVKIEYYEKGEDSEPIGTFTTTDGEKFRFGHIYSKARSDHNKEFDTAHIIAGIKSGHYDNE